MLNKNYWKTVIYASSGASVVSVLFVVFLYKGLQVMPLGGKKEVVAVFLIIAMLLACLVNKRQKVISSFKENFGLCLWVSISTCLFTCIGLWLLFDYSFTNMITEYVMLTEKTLLANKNNILGSGITEAAYKEALINLKNTNMQSILTDHVIKQLFIGIVPSLMISLYFSKNWK
jgi:hypothetical protein